MFWLMPFSSLPLVFLTGSKSSDADKNMSRTTAVLCPPPPPPPTTALSSVQVDSLWKWKSQGNLMSAVPQFQKKQTQREVGGGRERMDEDVAQLVSFSRLFCEDPVHLTSGIYNEPLLSVTDISPRPPSWLHLLSRTQRTQTEKGKRQRSHQGKSVLILYLTICTLSTGVFVCDINIMFWLLSPSVCSISVCWCPRS